MTLVVDASVVVAGLVDSGFEGSWAEELLVSDALVAPHLLPVEVANVLRRAGYIAIAESVDAPLATLDRRLTRSPNARCRFVAPTG